MFLYQTTDSDATATNLFNNFYATPKGSIRLAACSETEKEHHLIPRDLLLDRKVHFADLGTVVEHLAAAVHLTR